MTNYDRSKSKHKDHLVYKTYITKNILKYNKDLDIWDFYNTVHESYYSCLTCTKEIDKTEIDF